MQGAIAIERMPTLVGDPAFRRVESSGAIARTSSAVDKTMMASTSFPDPKAVVRRMLEKQASQAEEAFFVADLGALTRQHRNWSRLLPRAPFYAIKCNTDPQVLRALLPLCAGFDCASKGEIDTMLSLGVPPENVIYANPCKPPSHIRYARDRGVHLMTFDNADELYKVKAINPHAQMVLRIMTDDKNSVCRFSTKFGVHPDQTMGLLVLAKSLGLDVVGVSFHVGSGCQDPWAYDDALRRARRVFEEGASLGFNFTLLDVGGGFPGDTAASSDADGASHKAVTFEAIAAVLGRALEEHFPEPHVRVIAEPGRFYAASVFTLATCITSRRVVESEDGTEDTKYYYYVNDGVYGSFNCILFDHAQARPKVLLSAKDRLKHKDEEEEDDDQVVCAYVDEGAGSGSDTESDEGERLYESIIWGPTCDSMDCLTKHAQLPALDVGDWLFYEDMGAYTVAAATTFNGFDLSRIVYINTETSSAQA